MKYIYGPLKSRRLGLSLGLTLTNCKICSFDCVYCQLGPTASKTGERKEYVNITEILDELRLWLQLNPAEAARINFITISGSGEPTLNIRIGELISGIKKISGLPLAVITNSSLFSNASVRQALIGADVVIPSLDAVTQKIFEAIDRPVPGATIGDIIQGLQEFRKEFRGQIWLEVMLVSGINDDLRHIKKLKEVIENIRPDKVQLNSPVRATANSEALPTDTRKLRKIREVLGEGCEII